MRFFYFLKSTYVANALTIKMRLKIFATQPLVVLALEPVRSFWLLAMTIV
jgi:hypothetical protein